MKTNNIIMGVLVAVVAVMGVAFAAFSTQLTISGTASIQSNWSIEFEAGNSGNCTAVSKDAGAPSSGTVVVNGTTATVTALMSSPGDTLECTIIAKNTGSLPAIRKSWKFTNLTGDGMITSDESLGVSNMNITISALSNDVLEPQNGTETLKMNFHYWDSAEDKAESHTITAVAVYEQALQ